MKFTRLMAAPATLLTKRVLARVAYVEEVVLVLVLLVYRTHQCCGWRKGFIDEDKNGLLRRELDTLADHVDELADGQIRGHQILLFVDCRNVCSVRLLAYNGNAIRVLLTNTLSLSLALVEGVFVLEFGTH